MHRSLRRRIPAPSGLAIQAPSRHRPVRNRDIGEVLVQVQDFDVVGKRAAGFRGEVEAAGEAHDVDTGAGVDLPVAAVMQDEDVVARRCRRSSRCGRSSRGRHRRHRRSTADHLPPGSVVAADIEVEGDAVRRALVFDGVDMLVVAAVVEVVARAMPRDDDVVAVAGKNLVVAGMCGDSVVAAEPK